MSLTKVQLLSPRYKVIADYPESIYPVGAVIKEADNYQGAVFFQTTVHKYSNIFRPMEWWEERSPQEMPDYIKIDHGEIIAFFKHLIVSGELFYKQLDIPEDHKIFASSFCSPSTEVEYNTYINKQNGTNNSI